MENITQEVGCSQTERFTSPIPLKRPRTDCTMATHYSGKTGCHFPELFTFGETEGPASLLNDFENDAGRIQTAESECQGHQCKDTNINKIPVTEVTTSYTDGKMHAVDFSCEFTQRKGYPCEDGSMKDTFVSKATVTLADDNTHKGSSAAVSVYTADRHFPCLGKDETVTLIKTDKPSSSGDDAGGASAESHTSDDTRADASAHHDCKWLGKSMANVQNDHTYEEVLPYAGFRHAKVGSPEVGESNQKEDEHGFGHNTPFSKDEGKEAGIRTSHCDKGTESPCWSPVGRPSGNLAVDGKYEGGNASRWESDVKENAHICDGETKAQVNEDGMNNDKPTSDAIAEKAEYAEGSIDAWGVVLGGDIMSNVAEINISLKNDDACETTPGHAMGKMIPAAEAWSKMDDHTTETPMPASISQEPTGGDNDTSPFCVIDPSICSKADASSEEKRSNSESITGVGYTLSVQAPQKQTPLVNGLHTGPSEYTSRELSPCQPTTYSEVCSGRLKHEGENELTCQSVSEQNNYSITATTNTDTGNEGVHQYPSSSPLRPVENCHAGERREADVNAVGNLCGEMDPAGSISICQENLETLQAKCLQSGTAVMDGVMVEEGEREMGCCGGVKTVSDGNSITTVDRLWEHQNEEHNADMEISTSEWISDWTEGRMSKCDDKSTLPVEAEPGNEASMLNSSANYRLNTETFMVAHDDGPLPSFAPAPLSDAVVPGLCYLNTGPYSHCVDNTTTHAMGKMIPAAEAWSEMDDHTTETLMPMSISQEPTGGDNDTSPFGVIDPSFCSKADTSSEEKRSNLESITGVGYTLSVQAPQKQTPLVDGLYTGPSEYTSRELSPCQPTTYSEVCSGRLKYEGENEVTCQSVSEQNNYSITATTNTDTGNEGVHQYPSSSLLRPVENCHAGERREANVDAVGNLCGEMDPAGSISICQENLETLQAKGLQSGTAVMDGVMVEEGEREMGCCGGVKTVSDGNSIKTVDRLWEHQNEEHNADMEISTSEWISDWTEGRMSKCDDKSTMPVEAEPGNEASMLNSSTNYRLNTETFMVAHDDGPLPSFAPAPPSDAVVPGLCYLNTGPYSHCVDNTTTQCSHSMSVPSVPYALVPEVFDTFEKIQLSPDHAESLWEMLLPTSSPSQQFKTLEHQLHHSESDSEVEEEGGEKECQQENIGYEDLCSGYRSDEVPNCIVTYSLPAPARPEEPPSSQSSHAFCGPSQFDMPLKVKHSTFSTEGDIPVSEDISYPTFEMKEMFDLVLQELELYYEISQNYHLDTRALSSEQHRVRDDSRKDNTPAAECNGPREDDAPGNRACPSSLAAECNGPREDDAPGNRACPSSPAAECNGPREDDASGNRACPSSPAAECNGPREDDDPGNRACPSSPAAECNGPREDDAPGNRACPSSPAAECNGPREEDAPGNRACPSSPAAECNGDTSLGHHDDDCNLKIPGAEPESLCTTVAHDSEHDMPLDFNQHCPEEDESMYSPGKQIDTKEMCERNKLWLPSFSFLPYLEQLSTRQPDQHRRLEPLTTCSRPIRVGLSKRAKTKRLHQPHPYK